MSTSIELREHNGSVWLPVRVQPRSSRDAIVGVHDGALKIALTAPPVEGEANEALLRFLAKRLGIPRRQVALVQGEQARNKIVACAGVTIDEVTALWK